MTSKTPTDFDLEVLRSEVRPQRIAMSLKLSEATKSGDKRILDNLLRPKKFSPGALVGETAIRVSKNVTI